MRDGSDSNVDGRVDSTEGDGRYRRWVFSICGGMLLYFTQVTVLFPVLPLYVTQRWQGAPVGFVVGAMALGLLGFRPLIGWLIDRWGRKPVLGLGLGLMGLILPLYAAALTPIELMGVRVLHGISQAAFATASQTLLVDLVPIEQRTAMLGYLAMANTIGFSLGPLLGSLVFRQAGFEAVLGLMAGLSLLGVGLMGWLPERSHRAVSRGVVIQQADQLPDRSLLKPSSEPSSESSESLLDASVETLEKPAERSRQRLDESPEKLPRSFPGKSSAQLAVESATDPQSDRGFPWTVILRFPIRDATLLFFTGSFLHGAVVAFLPLWVPNAALFYSLNALVAVAIRFGLGRWGHRVSQRWVVSLGICCSGSALIGLAIAPQLLGIWSLLYGLGFGSLFPVLSAIVSLAAPAASRGRVYSIFLAGFDSGMTLGGAGIQPLLAVLPLNRLFLLLGGIGCGVSVWAFGRFGELGAEGRGRGSKGAGD